MLCSLGIKITSQGFFVFFYPHLFADRKQYDLRDKREMQSNTKISYRFYNVGKKVSRNIPSLILGVSK